MFILDDADIVDQGGKGRGSGKSGCDHCFFVFRFFLLYLGGGGRRRREATHPASQLAPVPWHEKRLPSVHPGFWCGIHAEGSARVLLMVLKGCQSHWSKGRGHWQCPLADIADLTRVSIRPGICCHCWAALVVQFVLLSNTCSVSFRTTPLCHCHPFLFTPLSFCIFTYLEPLICALFLKFSIFKECYISETIIHYLLGLNVF